VSVLQLQAVAGNGAVSELITSIAPKERARAGGLADGAHTGVLLSNGGDKVGKGAHERWRRWFDDNRAHLRWDATNSTFIEEPQT
jgi:hypothetical protein